MAVQHLVTLAPTPLLLNKGVNCLQIAHVCRDPNFLLRMVTVWGRARTDRVNCELSAGPCGLSTREPNRLPDLGQDSVLGVEFDAIWLGRER